VINERIYKPPQLLGKFLIGACHIYCQTATCASCGGRVPLLLIRKASEHQWWIQFMAVICSKILSVSVLGRRLTSITAIGISRILICVCSDPRLDVTSSSLLLERGREERWESSLVMFWAAECRLPAGNSRNGRRSTQPRCGKNDLNS
jgi:hypothetical protein